MDLSAGTMFRTDAKAGELALGEHPADSFAREYGACRPLPVASGIRALSRPYDSMKQPENAK
jgi:hypothetical protein